LYLLILMEVKVLVKAKIPGPRPLQLEVVGRKRSPGNIALKQRSTCENTARRFARVSIVSLGELYPICTRRTGKIEIHPRPTFTPARIPAGRMLDTTTQWVDGHPLVTAQHAGGGR
jgi:hypothetical protein